MTGRASQQKGKRGELELIHMLNDNLGLTLNRNYKQVAQAQHGDIEQLVGGFLIEVKNCKDLCIPAWWKQTVAAANAAGAVPCLAYKIAGAREPYNWRFVMPLPQGGRKAWSTDLNYTHTTYQDGFFLIVREMGA